MERASSRLCFVNMLIICSLIFGTVKGKMTEKDPHNRTLLVGINLVELRNTSDALT